MIKALFTAATGMQAQQTRIDVISNNIANVNTTGFKKSVPHFQDLLYSTLIDPDARNADGSTRPTGFQVGSGARLISTSRIYTPGVLQNTGRDLDLAISGDGFFRLNDLSGNSVYTRDGAFTVDAQGQMVNSQGLRLDPGIRIDAGARVSIAPDGTVSAKVGDSPATEVGRIEVVRFPNPAGLETVGQNLVQETVASGREIPGNPGEDGFGTLTQGFLEGSNVEVVDELVNLITSQRAYEINSRAISAADQMLTTVNNIIQ